MEAARDMTPDLPAYRMHHRLIEVVGTAALCDVYAASDRDWHSMDSCAAAAIDALVIDAEDRLDTEIANTAAAIARVRRSFAALSTPPADDPAASARSHAEAIGAAGDALTPFTVRLTDTRRYLRAVGAACRVASHLLLAEAAILDADRPTADIHAAAASRRARAALDELASHFALADPLVAPLSARLEAAETFTHADSAMQALADWSKLSLPLPLTKGPNSRQLKSPLSQPAHKSAASQPAVAVVLVSLDGNLITGPEVVRANRVYELDISVQVDSWPEWAEQLTVEFLSHLTEAEITIPNFVWSRDDHIGDSETYTKTGTMVLRFTVGPGSPAPPFMTRLVWRGRHENTTVSQPLDVTGHRELRLRPYDATRDRATDYPVFDERLLAIYDSLARAGYDSDHLQAFCRLLTSICRIGLKLTWDKKYRRGTKVTERQFHNDLHDQLVADPELGGRVERGSPLALGFLDVRHDGITAELKVERKTPVSRASAPKYMGQPTQYAAADGARLSILTILDMSPKLQPVGTPENYLFTLEPRLHGLDNPEAPSLVAVLIVNGNLPTPSSWSRRKLPPSGL